jgi:hypothetical protein
MLDVVPTLTSLYQRFNGAIFSLVVVSSSLLCIAGWNETWLALLFAYGLFLAFQADSGGILTTLKVAIIFIGFATTAGLLAGLLNVRLVGEPNARYLLLVLLLATLSVFRTNSNSEFRSEDSLARHVSYAVFATVGIAFFLLSTIKNVFGWLLNTWDGGSQPGIITQVWYQGNIDYVGEIPTGFVGYPRGIHFVESLILSTLTDATYSPKIATSFFALANIVMYTILLATVMLVARQLFCLIDANSNESKGKQFFTTLGAPVVFFSSFFVNGLFFLHSVNFWIAVVCTLTALQVLISLLDKSGSAKNIGHVDALCLTACIIITGHNYPILLPLVSLIAILALGTLIQKRNESSGTKARVRTFVITCNLFSLTVAAISFYNFLKYPSTEGDRFQFSGAINTLPLSAIITILTLALLWLYSNQVSNDAHQFEKFLLPLVFLGVIGIWMILWYLAGSSDRSFGANYYPKKYEYALVILVLPFAFAYLDGLLNRVNLRPSISFFSTNLIFIRMIALSIFILGIFNFSNPITSLARANVALSDAVVHEAGIPGPSTIVSESGNISLAASIMSNSIDISFWENPHADIPLYHFGGNIIANSGIVEERKPCEITDILGGPSRVYDLSRDIGYECWK